MNNTATTTPTTEACERCDFEGQAYFYTITDAVVNFNDTHLTKTIRVCDECESLINLFNNLGDSSNHEAQQMGLTC